MTRDMAAAGVGILAGCDAMIAGFCVHDELAAMVAARHDAAGSAADGHGQSGALSRSRDRRSEPWQRARQADLVLLDANPLEDIGNVRRIQRRYHRRTFLRQECARSAAHAGEGCRQQ